MSKLTEIYLYFLQEREWTDGNPDYKLTMKDFKELLGDLHGISNFDNHRQAFQPSTFDIYLKNVIGDYRGRNDMQNSRRVYTFGYEDIKKKLPALLKRKKQAMSKGVVPKKTWDNLTKLMYNTDPTKLHNDVAI